MTVIGVRSSCETDARKRSFSAEARWSSCAVRAMRLRCSSSSSFCSARRRDCSATRSLAEALARATARRGAIAESALRAGAVNGCAAPRDEHADGMIEIDERNVTALARKDPAVEEVDRRRLRIDREEDRAAFLRRAAGLLAPDPAVALDRLPADTAGVNCPSGSGR